MLTRDEINLEYYNCIVDPKYAITNYLKTFDKTQEGFVPFKLFKKQSEIVDDYEKYRFNLVTKPRQAGISTTTQAYMAVKCAFASKDNPECIIVIANKLKLAKKFTKGIKDFISQLPRWVWGDEYYGTKEKEAKSIFLKDSQEEIELVNFSKIIAVATSTDALRGFTPTYLVFDEAAFIENGAELYAAAITSLGTGGGAILISTPNGQDSLYYETYDNAIKGKNDYNIIDMKWYQDPRYNKDLRWKKGEEEQITEIEHTHESYENMIRQGYKPTSTWYESMCKGMNNDKKQIAQELDVSFLGSGGNVIDDEDIIRQEKMYTSDNFLVDKTYFNGQDGLIKVWGVPEEGHQYILAADVARGDGSDFSAMVIVDFTTMEQVVEFQGKLPPDIFAKVIFEYGTKYNAYVIVDNIGVGDTTASKLVEMKYPNLHYDKTTPHSKVELHQPDILNDNKKVAGFNINGVRLNLISHLEYMIRTDGIKVRSKAMVGEMRTFIYLDNGRPDHQAGKHDDLLMALGMALWVLEHSFKKLEKAASQTKAMLNAWLTVNTDTNNNNNTTFVPQKGAQPTPRPNFSPVVSKNMQDPKGQYGWLFSGMK